MATYLRRFGPPLTAGMEHSRRSSPTCNFDTPSYGKKLEPTTDNLAIGSVTKNGINSRAIAYLPGPDRQGETMAPRACKPFTLVRQELVAEQAPTIIPPPKSGF